MKVSKLLDMPPLTEINEDGVRFLMDAVCDRAIRDYIIDLAYIKKHGETCCSVMRDMEICEWFLGELVIDRIDKLIGDSDIEVTGSRLKVND